MILYHGSYTVIENPDLRFSRLRTDFGIRGVEVIANRTLIGHKCYNVIKAYSEREGIPLREAFDIFYKSNLYLEITGGISDMHCRSDGYLAEELSIEVKSRFTLFCD